MFMRNMTTPLGSGVMMAGRPTVRKAQVPSGRRRTQEANADGRKATGNREPVYRPSAEWLPHNWSDTGVMPGPKGS